MVPELLPSSLATMIFRVVAGAGPLDRRACAACGSPLSIQLDPYTTLKLGQSSGSSLTLKLRLGVSWAPYSPSLAPDAPSSYGQRSQ